MKVYNTRTVSLTMEVMFLKFIFSTTIKYSLVSKYVINAFNQPVPEKLYVFFLAFFTKHAWRRSRRQISFICMRIYKKKSFSNQCLCTQPRFQTEIPQLMQFRYGLSLDHTRHTRLTMGKMKPY